MTTAPRTALFDSLAHPTLTGRWLSSGADAGVDALLGAMRSSGFAAACAVGIANIEDYDHERFAELCRPHPELIPIAGLNPAASDIDSEFDLILRLGYRGVKIHPRFSRVTTYDRSFRAALQGAGDRDLVVFLCTYFHEPAAAYPTRDPFYGLAEALHEAPDTKIVLLHGGDVELMRYMQLARHSPNLLLDASFTMMKYRGSSLDNDLRYMFKHFNRRLCIGTDHPEYSHASLRERFDELSMGLDETEREHVGSKNLAQFLGVNLQ